MGEIVRDLNRYSEDERPIPPLAPASCADCGMLYGTPTWIEAIVPNDIWEIITPSYHKGAGILCIQCIANRCHLAGLDDVPIKIFGRMFVSVDYFQTPL